MIWSPENYNETAVVAREAGHEMISRLEWVKLQPELILDVGCGTGEMSALLQKHYPQARVISIDLSQDMLHKFSSSSGLAICGLAEKLPVTDQCVDLIFANFLSPWINNIESLLNEWRRVLKPEGLLMFTALGPDTLKEGREVWKADDMPNLIDMHDLGDALVHSGFADPVMDVDYLTLSYRDQHQLIKELQMSGMLFNPTSLPDQNENWEVTFEIIYAHAWAPSSKAGYAANDEGVAKIPLSALRRDLRS